MLFIQGDCLILNLRAHNRGVLDAHGEERSLLIDYDPSTSNSIIPGLQIPSRLTDTTSVTCSDGLADGSAEPPEVRPSILRVRAP
jgi:hypothetical protein